MDGRAFLDVARRSVKGSTEADWRDAAGRTYYALLLEGRTALRRWGFAAPRRDQIHAFVRMCFSFAADADLKNIGYTLDRLGRLRNEADYQIDAPGKFVTSKEAERALRDAEQALVEYH
jgi:HEPN domain